MNDVKVVALIKVHPGKDVTVFATGSSAALHLQSSRKCSEVSFKLQESLTILHGESLPQTLTLKMNFP